jgi:hypothetical protein
MQAHEDVLFAAVRIDAQAYGHFRHEKLQKN